jgi:hypothetical protein
MVVDGSCRQGFVILRRRVTPVQAAASRHGTVAVDDFAERTIQPQFDAREAPLGGDGELGGGVRRWPLRWPHRWHRRVRWRWHGCDGALQGGWVVPRRRRWVAVVAEENRSRVVRGVIRVVSTGTGVCERGVALGTRLMRRLGRATRRTPALRLAAIRALEAMRLHHVGELCQRRAAALLLRQSTAALPSQLLCEPSVYSLLRDDSRDRSLLRCA